MASITFEQIASQIGHNTREVLNAVRAAGIEPREAALRLSRARVGEAMALRRNP